MNEHTWMQAYEYNQQHIHQLQHIAENNRLAKQARPGRNLRRPTARILYALGQQIYRLGQRMQHQYQPVPERQLSRSTTGG